MPASCMLGLSRCTAAVQPGLTGKGISRSSSTQPGPIAATLQAQSSSRD